MSRRAAQTLYGANNFWQQTQITIKWLSRSKVKYTHFYSNYNKMAVKVKSQIYALLLNLQYRERHTIKNMTSCFHIIGNFLSRSSEGHVSPYSNHFQGTPQGMFLPSYINFRSAVIVWTETHGQMPIKTIPCFTSKINVQNMKLSKYVSLCTLSS